MSTTPLVLKDGETLNIPFKLLNKSKGMTASAELPCGVLSLIRNGNVIKYTVVIGIFYTNISFQSTVTNISMGTSCGTTTEIGSAGFIPYTAISGRTFRVSIYGYAYNLGMRVAVIEGYTMWTCY